MLNDTPRHTTTLIIQAARYYPPSCRRYPQLERFTRWASGQDRYKRDVGRCGLIMLINDAQQGRAA